MVILPASNSLQQLVDVLYAFVFIWLLSNAEFGEDGFEDFGGGDFAAGYFAKGLQTGADVLG